MTDSSLPLNSVEVLKDLVLRTAEHRDLTAISSLYNFYVKSSTATFACVEETLEERKSWFQAHVDDKKPIYVADLHGRVLGFASLSSYSNRCGYKDTCEISIYIDPVCVSRGIGKSLLDRLLEDCRRQYHVALALICSENEHSLRLFRSRGFEEVGKLRQVGYKFDRFFDVSILELICRGSRVSSMAP